MPSLGARLRSLVLKPADPDSAQAAEPEAPKTAAELQAALKSADDKERLVGLLAAPLAAIIGITVISVLIADDPAVKNHVSVSLYHELLLVLLGLSMLMLVLAWLRKRLYLGIVMALYGLAVFNLHYWGFGLPFILAAAWLLVRSYRLQRDLKAATADGADPLRGNAKASKRYTPPAAPPKRSR